MVAFNNREERHKTASNRLDAPALGSFLVNGCHRLLRQEYVENIVYIIENSGWSIDQISYFFKMFGSLMSKFVQFGQNGIITAII